MAQTNTATLASIRILSRLRARRLLCVCGIDDSKCMVESQIDGDCSAHDARIAENGNGCPSCGAVTHASDSNDDGVCSGCLGDAAIWPDETEADRIGCPGYAFGGPL